MGLDQDLAAIAAASRRLETYGERVTLCHARFDSLGRVLDDLGHRQISACLLDLGVSSPQLDVAERGFSYRHEGPLDMRMDTTRGATAADIVNGASARELADILWHNADERHSRRIARSIIRHRPLTTTTQLASAVAAAVPRATRRAGHPAKRTFQALRIEVNSELGVLPVALQEALDRLAPGGRCAVFVVSLRRGSDCQTCLQQGRRTRSTTPSRPSTAARRNCVGAVVVATAPYSQRRRDSTQPTSQSGAPSSSRAIG